MKEKQCTKCASKMKLSSFNKDKRSKDGYRSECRLCHYIMQADSLVKKIKELEDERK